MDNNNPKKNSPLDEIKKITGQTRQPQVRRGPAPSSAQSAAKKPSSNADIPVVPVTKNAGTPKKPSVQHTPAQMSKEEQSKTRIIETPQKPAATQPKPPAAPKKPPAPANKPDDPKANNSKTRITTAVPPSKKSALPSKGASPSNKKEPKKAKEEKDDGRNVGHGILVGSVKAVIYLVAVFVISGCLALFTILVANDCFAFVKSDEEITIKLPEDATLDDIADILYENDVISYPNIFKLYINIRNKGIDDYLDGEFMVKPSMSYDTLISTFKPHTIREEVTITITEGSTTQEIIDIFLAKGIGTQEGFEEAINDIDYDFWFLEDLTPDKTKNRCFRLDGYLFPDTYNFFTDSSEEEIIHKLLSNFDAKFAQENLALVEDLGMTLDDIIVLASMVQNEAKYVNTCKNELYGSKGDYYMVSAVFHNRINDPSVTNGKLDSDATVLYAMKNARRYAELFKNTDKYDALIAKAEEYEPLFEKIDKQKQEIERIKATEDSDKKTADLEKANEKLDELNNELSLAIADANKNYDTLYNSYIYSGLPNGPICNPSLNAINAAMNPDASSKGVYYFFIADTDGHNLYAKNQTEHNKNIETVRKNSES